MLSFHFKFVQTDRWTTVKQYAPDLSNIYLNRLPNSLLLDNHINSLPEFDIYFFYDMCSSLE